MMARYRLPHEMYKQKWHNVHLCLQKYSPLSSIRVLANLLARSFVRWNPHSHIKLKRIQYTYINMFKHSQSLSRLFSPPPPLYNT